MADLRASQSLFILRKKDIVILIWSGVRPVRSCTVAAIENTGNQQSRNTARSVETRCFVLIDRFLQPVWRFLRLIRFAAMLSCIVLQRSILSWMAYEHKRENGLGQYANPKLLSPFRRSVTKPHASQSIFKPFQPCILRSFKSGIKCRHTKIQQAFRQPYLPKLVISKGVVADVQQTLVQL